MRLRAVAARSAQHDVVCGHLIPRALFDAPQSLFEAIVLERIDLAAVVAHDVMVMVTAGLSRLVARRSVAELDLLDEAVGAELVERPIDAREPNSAAGGAKEVEDLLGGDAAGLSSEQIDDRAPGSTVLARPEGAVLPGHCHSRIIAYLRMTLIIV